MVYDLNTYRRTIKPQIKEWCEAKGGSPETHLSELALYTSCPIVCVGYFMGELYGFTDVLKEKIDMLEKFYRVENIEGKII